MGGWSGQTFVVKNSTFVVKDQNFPDFFTGFVRFLNTLDGVFRMEIVFFRACGARQVPSPPSPTMFTSRFTPRFTALFTSQSTSHNHNPNHTPLPTTTAP